MPTLECALLLDHYPDEHAKVIEHLDFAIGEFREVKDDAFAEARARPQASVGGVGPAVPS